MYFPLFFDISRKNILIVGGGTIANRRVHTLLPFAENITVVAPEYTDALRELADQNRIQLLTRTFNPEDLINRDIVLAATNDTALNRKIAFLCRERSIPVNVSSDQTLCDFQFPSVVTDGEVVIGINASGKNHRLVKETRMEIEKMFS